MADPFILVSAAALIFLGQLSENYWLSIAAAGIALALNPSVETLVWLIVFFFAGFVFHFGQKGNEFLANSYTVFLLMVAAMIVLVVAGFVFWAVIVAGVLIVLLVLSPSIRLGKKTYRKGKEEYDTIRAEVGAAKGQFPNSDVIERGLKSMGGKLGDFSASKKDDLKSPNLPLRVSKGAKNILDDFFKLFK